jgi:hypothetical protein
MSNYAIRVELRGNPTWEQYDRLHALMARQGFLQTIKGVSPDGTQQVFNLPHAVYYGPSNASPGAVRDSVSKAVKAEVQPDVVVFAVAATDWAIGG